MKKTLLLLLAFSLLCAFRADNLPANFITLLNRTDMNFTLPAGYAAVAVVKNNQMVYHYAIKSADRNFEVRYAVRPLDSIMNVYNDWLQNKDGKVMTNPNNLYKLAFTIIMANLSRGSGRMPQIKAFDSLAVKRDFNADWGAVGLCIPTGNFSAGYKYLNVTALHKNNQGDAYIFYLTDNVQDLQTAMPPIYTALKFR
ncbi:hypothetical protein ABZR88_07125 [Mucilaginibacter yixingensis]|nr:hypothetical protein [Mucilaginibacter yixingensis]